jgi:hypothetical protein
LKAFEKSIIINGYKGKCNGSVKDIVPRDYIIFTSKNIHSRGRGSGWSFLIMAVMVVLVVVTVMVMIITVVDDHSVGGLRSWPWWFLFGKKFLHFYSHVCGAESAVMVKYI